MSTVRQSAPSLIAPAGARLGVGDKGTARPAQLETGVAWLLRLRASALVLEIIVLVASVALGTPPASALFVATIFLLQLLSNAAGAWWMRSTPTSLKMALLLAVDVLAFTALLAVTGGASNPFSFLYLVFVALAGVVLNVWQSSALVALSILGFGSLFLIAPGDDEHAGHAGHAMHGIAPTHDAAAMQSHVLGMWIACSVGAVFIVFFLQRLTKMLRAREHELERLREQRERDQRLAALGTLAAGAAHELSTPLSTIAIAAREMLDVMQADPAYAPLLPEAAAIRGEVDRCRDVLEHLAADAGQDPADTVEDVAPKALVATALKNVKQQTRVVVSGADAVDDVTLRVPPKIASRALRGLLTNALAASTENVELRLSPQANGCAFVVIDRGEGMTDETLSRSTEPFFTTKEQGEGMGLGLFLATNVATRLGGYLRIESEVGEGTRATFWLPGTGAAFSTTESG